MSLDGAHPSVRVIGDLCLDHNEVGGRKLEPTWGSPALFIARQLERSYGLRAVVSGAYGADLAPFLDGFTLDREPGEGRSLAYRNITGAGGEGRVQYWRAGTVAAEAAEVVAAGAEADLAYFCPLVPDSDRAADLAELRASRGDRESPGDRQSLRGGATRSEGASSGDRESPGDRQSLRGGATWGEGASSAEGASSGEGAAGVRVQVLLAQGLMRVSAGESRGGWRRVERRDITDEEAAGWGCFDIVVFSDEDLDDAVAKAVRWSAVSRQTGFVVTQGGMGATLCYRGEATTVPVEPVGESSPVGAGDVFGAAVGWEFYSAFVPGGLDRGAALGLAVSRATASASAYALSAGGVGH